MTDDDRLAVEPLRGVGIETDARPWSATGIGWKRFDAVVIRSCWDYHARPSRFLAWLDHLDASGARVLNPTSMLRWNLDKRYLEDFHRRGIPTEPTLWFSRHARVDLASVLKDQGWDRAVIKPTVSASARRTWLVDRERAAIDQAAFDRMLDRRAVMVQRYNPAIRSHGELSLVFFGETYSHAVVKRPAPGEFRVQTKMGGTVETASPPTWVVRDATRVVRAAGEVSVYARVDGVIDHNAFVLMELELIEPSLFLAHDPNAPQRFATAIAGAVRRA